MTSQGLVWEHKLQAGLLYALDRCRPPPLDLALPVALCAVDAPCVHLPCGPQRLASQLILPLADVVCLVSLIPPHFSQKIKEITYMHSEGILAGELKHGPLALIDKQMPIIMVIMKDPCFAKCQNALQQITARQVRALRGAGPPAPSLPDMPTSATVIPAMPGSCQ